MGPPSPLWYWRSPTANSERCVVWHWQCEVVMARQELSPTGVTRTGVRLTRSFWYSWYLVYNVLSHLESNGPRKQVLGMILLNQITRRPNGNKSLLLVSCMWHLTYCGVRWSYRWENWLPASNPNSAFTDFTQVILKWPWLGVFTAQNCRTLQIRASPFLAFSWKE